MTNNKILSELELADLSLVQLGKDGKPECKVHGAMNKVTSHGLWRCLAEYTKTVDTSCRAGCVMKESN